MTTAAPARALHDTVVLDLGQVYNGPYAAALLRGLGATVIKVEPLGGELIRSRTEGAEGNHSYNLVNAGKRGIRVDLKSTRGRDVFLRLVQRADVLIENFAPGVMERLYLSYDHLAAVNPRIIVGSGKGYGSTGPNSALRGMDITVQAMSGIISTTGFPDQPPVKAGPAVSDFNAGVHLATAVLAALYQRERTGRGQYVEVAMQDAIVPSLASNIAGYLDHHGDFPERTGNRHGGLSVAPYNVYPASDGWIAILCMRERHWNSLCALMERDDLAEDPRLQSPLQRVQHMDEIDEAIQTWTKGLAKEELATVIQAADIPCAPVRSLGEVLYDPHLRARGMIAEVRNGESTYTVFGSPLKLADSTAMPAEPPPGLGEHTAEILSELLGMPEHEIAELRRDGVI